MEFFLDRYERINLKCLLMNIIGGINGNRAIIQKSSAKTLKILNEAFDKLGGVKQDTSNERIPFEIFL